GQLISAGQSILLVPLFLRAWGSEGYGHWLTLTACTSYLFLLDLGGQQYIANVLTLDRARDDTAAFRNTFSEALSLFSVIAAAALVGIVIFVFGLAPLLGSVGGPVIDASDRWVILLTSASLLV